MPCSVKEDMLQHQLNKLWLGFSDDLDHLFLKEHVILSQALQNDHLRKSLCLEDAVFWT